MKNVILKILILILLLIAASSESFSQTQPSKTVSKGETIAFLIQENKNAREVIAKQDKHIQDLEAELEAEKENSESLSKSYEAAKGEIDSLRQSNEALSRAVQLNEKTIALLQEDNQKQREKVKKANRAKWKAYAIAAGAIALKLLL